MLEQGPKVRVVERPDKMPRFIVPQIPGDYRLIHRNVINDVINELTTNSTLSPHKRHILQSFKAENALLTYIYYFEGASTHGVEEVAHTLHVSSHDVRKSLLWVYNHASNIWDSYYEKYTLLRAERDTRYKNKKNVRQIKEPEPPLPIQLINDPHAIELIQTLRAQGMTTEVIARKLGVTERTTRRIIGILLDSGVLPRLVTKYSPEEREVFRQEIIRLRAERVSDNQISKRLGIDPKLIRDIMKS